MIEQAGCIHEQKLKGHRVGDRVWVKSSRQYATITKCNLPAPCSVDCFYFPCGACGGKGVDELQKDRRCRVCGGWGRRSP